MNPRRPNKARGAVVALMAALVLALAACGEKPQTDAAPMSGKYQGKPDTHPWDNPPLAFGSGKVAQGDKAAWEDQIKLRAQAQNEYVRIR